MREREEREEREERGVLEHFCVTDRPKNIDELIFLFMGKYESDI